MKLQTLAILLGCALWCSLARGEDAVLMWANGDSLGGMPAAGDGSALTWRSPLFSEMLKIELGALSSVRFPNTPIPPAEQGEFRIVMRNGDALSGRLTAITGEVLHFESTRWGKFTLPRAMVLSLQKGNNAGVIYSGPRGLNGWQAVQRNSNVNQRVVVGGAIVNRAANAEFQLVPFGGAPAAASPGVTAPATANWAEDPDGSISTNKADAAAFLPMELPDRFEIDIEVHSRAACSFSLAIGPPNKQGLQLDTWIDSFVITQANTPPAQLRLIGPQDHVVRIRTFVDYTQKKASVYSVSGSKLGEIPITKDWKVSGLTLRKRDSDLTLRRLRVSHWDGTPPRFISSGDTLVQMADGQTRLGSLKGFDSQTSMLTLAVEGEERTIPLAEVSTVIVSGDDANPVVEHSPASAAWLDGSLISGRFLSIDGEFATFSTGYSEQPLRCHMGGLSRLGFAGTATGNDQVDRLIHAGGTLRGNLIVDGEGTDPIRFKPIGGQNSSSLRNGGDARFLRGATAAHFSQYPDLLKGYPDMIYLTNNDVLPCRILGCTEEEVRLETPFTQMRSFPTARVRAVEFSQPGRRNHRGLGGEGWKGTIGKVADKPDLAVLASGAVVNHADVMSGDTLRFQMEWPQESYSTLSVLMFAGAPQNNAAPRAGVNANRAAAGAAAGINDPDATPVTFLLMPSQMQILDQKLPADPIQLINQVGNGNTDGLVQLGKNSAAIEIAIRDGSLSVSINGHPTKSIKMNPAGAGRRGLTLASNVLMTGNGRIQLSSVLGGNANPSVTISQFEIDTVSGGNIRQFIEEEARLAMLTVPRFRRESPPTHVLLAPNGDMLRGRLTDIDGENVLFESRLEPLRFERQRVAAVVWLHPELVLKPENKEPAEAAPPARDETAVQAYLSDGYQITLTPKRMVNGQLQGNSPDLGECSVPAATIRELYLGNPVNREQLAAYIAWTPRFSKEPDWDIPAADGGNSEAHAMIGQVAEDFALPLLDGTTFRLSEHKDKVIVLDFWATWCGPCVMALPEYIEALQEFEGQPVLFLAVNQQEAADHVRGFLAEHKFEVGVALDRAGEVGSQFKVSGIPHTVILSKGNVIEDLHVGYIPGTADTLKLNVEAMLKGTWKRPEPKSPPVEQAPERKPSPSNSI